MFGGAVSEPWFVSRDFNTVVADDERIGCHSSRGLAQDFDDFILGVGLLDVEFNGNKYTWSRREHGVNTK